jgi:hypothetical protein
VVIWVIVTFVALIVVGGVNDFLRVKNATHKLAVTTQKLNDTTRELKSLVHTECHRSIFGAQIRNEMIASLTHHTPIAPGSPPALVKTVTDFNSQLDRERVKLLAVGAKIPQVKCP